MQSSMRPQGTAARGRRGTYSIVAHDPQTGEFGAAVQSHWFSVGPLVPWAQPGVGAACTQANVEVSYGPRALALMADGVRAQDALERLLAEDEGAHGRQVALVDAHGGVAAHTGASCMEFAGHVIGEGVSCQGNIMASAIVWERMLEAYSASSGPLAGRLLTALDAAQAAGGDVRGSQSAAIIVVPARGEWWETTVSLRVEDHPQPLVELRRLMRLHEAYVLAGRGDALTNEGRYREAATLYRQASALAPDNHELLFWSGLGTIESGQVEAGLEQVRRAIELQPGWRELLPRLSDEVAPAAGVARAHLGIGTA